MKILIALTSMLLFHTLLQASFLETFFTQAYQDAINGRWGKIESASGPGSTTEQTKIICHMNI